MATGQDRPSHAAAAALARRAGDRGQPVSTAPAPRCACPGSRV